MHRLTGAFVGVICWECDLNGICSRVLSCSFIKGGCGKSEGMTTEQRSYCHQPSSTSQPLVYFGQKLIVRMTKMNTKFWVKKSIMMPKKGLKTLQPRAHARKIFRCIFLQWKHNGFEWNFVEMLKNVFITCVPNVTLVCWNWNLQSWMWHIGHLF